jgi:hypothetical protein
MAVPWCAPARWKEYGVPDDELALQELPERGDRGLGCRKAEHDGVADGLDEFVAGPEHIEGTVAKCPHDRHRLGISMRFRHCGEPGKVDEREG